MTSLQLYKDNLLLGFDDQEVYLVKQGQIESSNNTEQVQIKHPFAGEFSFVGGNDRLLVIESEHGKVH